MTTYLPISTIRYITDIDLPQRVLTSKRYAPYAKHLFQRINKPDFQGVWIIRNGFATEPEPDLDPEHSDIVIYYLHGGGYCTSSPATYTLFLLHLAESIIRAGKSVSIFALDYDLAPEAPFPTQLIQAGNAYEWLTRGKSEGGVGIDLRKVVIMGDSAGGHLSLSLLVDLRRPLMVEGHDRVAKSSGIPGKDPRPGLGLVMMSPWLSLLHVPDSFTRNAHTDILTQKFLYNVATDFLGPDCHGTVPREKLPWLDFLDEKSGIPWVNVLPDWVWVSAGKNELLYDDVVRWVSDRQKDITRSVSGRGTQGVVGELNEEEAHDYAWLKSVDQVLSRRLCGQEMGKPTGMTEFDAVERIGKAIVERWKVVF